MDREDGPVAYDLWQVDLSEVSGYEEIYDDRYGTVKEVRVYERIYKRNLFYLATRQVRSF